MKQKSKFFLVYSVALFSFALILILFSTFTGMRYKEETDSKIGLYANATSNAEALTKQNEQLMKEINEKDTAITELNKTIETLEADKENFAKLSAAGDKLMQVQYKLNDKSNGDSKKEAKELFDSFTPEEIESINALGESAHNLFEQIRAELSDE